MKLRTSNAGHAPTTSMTQVNYELPAFSDAHNAGCSLSETRGKKAGQGNKMFNHLHPFMRQVPRCICTARSTAYFGSLREKEGPVKEKKGTQVASCRSWHPAGQWQIVIGDCKIQNATLTACWAPCSARQKMPQGGSCASVLARGDRWLGSASEGQSSHRKLITPEQSLFIADM